MCLLSSLKNVRRSLLRCQCGERKLCLHPVLHASKMFNSLIEWVFVDNDANAPELVQCRLCMRYRL